MMCWRKQVLEHIRSEAGFWSAMVVFKGLLAWGIMAGVYRSGVAFFGLCRCWSWTLPVAGILYGAMTVASAFRPLLGSRTGWRHTASGQ